MARRSPFLSFIAFLPQGALLGIARALPYRARLGFAGGLMRALVATVPDLRARVEGNLRLIFPQLPAAERARIRSAMADSFGRTFVEIFSNRAFQARASWSQPAGPGWEALRARLEAGQGAILVSGHFGQWEAVRAALKARGTEVAALYRPVKNPWLERTYLDNLRAGGRPVFPRGGGGLRELVRHLRRGGTVAVLLDQHTRRGTPIEFLGRPAPSGTMIAELAGKYRVPMFPVYGTRGPDGEHVIVEIEAPIPPGPAEAMTQAAADSLAARVRARPEQYYWLHRRWVKRLQR